MAGQCGFFDADQRLRELSEAGDPLERLLAVVDFEIFRDELNAALRRSDRRKGGRPPLDAVMMFKVLVLQALYGLSDEAAEYQIRDRLSFMRFLGLGLGDAVPDRTTVWLFREALGAIDTLFARFDAELKRQGYFALGGQIIDASLVEAPKQRLSAEEKRQIRDGETPSWPRAKARQKDTEARWTIKRGRVKRKPGPQLTPPNATERTAEALMIPAFGYKNHINIDRRFGFIRRFVVTDAAAYDGQRLAALLNPDAFDSRVWADTAYRSAANERVIEAAGRVSMIHFRKPPGRSMPAPHRRANQARSAVRAHVEHPFAEQKARMGLFVRTIGRARATVKIGMANLAYNFRRLAWQQRCATA
jgi:transposase, IS5 family